MTDHDNLPARYRAEPALERRPDRGPVALPAPHYERIPIFDLNRFEIVCKIAERMAAAALCPNALCGYEEDGKFVSWPEKQIAANCFLVVSQAMNWRMDPFALAQCVSIVRGKLMYEGKAVAAAIEANLGLRLSYTYSGELYQTSRTVTVSGQYHDEPEPRTIMGSVEHWKTDGKASPWTPKNFDRQLAYRGAREWARRHAPGIILGIVTDDEDIEADRRPAPQIAQSAGQAPAIAIATGFAKPKAAARKKAAQEPQEQAQDDEGAPTADQSQEDPEDAGTAEEERQEQGTAPEMTNGPTDPAAEREQAARSAWAEQIHEAKDWKEIRAAMDVYAKAMAPMPPDQVSAIRRGAWKRMEQIADEDGEILTPADDMNLFACFIHGCDNADTLRNVLNSAQTGESYGRLNKDTRAALKQAAVARIAALEAAQ